MAQDPRFIYIELDDEITDVFQKISQSKEPSVYLVFPVRSLLLASVVNMKLLKKKSEQLKKEIAIVSADPIARNLASQAGITAYKDNRELHHGIEDEPEEEVEETREDRLAKGKEWFLKVMKKLRVDNEEAKEEKVRVVFSKPSQKAFITVLFFSVIVLFTITFFALPEAKIVISPKLATMPVVTNITLSPQPTNLEEKIVHIEPITVEYEKIFKQPVSGRNMIGARSKGVVTVFNETSKEWPIVKESRLQSPDGIIYLTQKFITIPPATEDKPGQIEVEVEARDDDTHGNFIGSRGNIGPSKFIFPGLSDVNQKLAYAESYAPMTGGTDDVELFVKSEDLERGNKNIILELNNLATEKLQEQLEERFQEGEHSYEIFGMHDDRFVKTTLLEVKLPKNVVNKKVDHIEVYGRMKAEAYYLNRNDVEEILEEHLQNHQLTFREKLLSMDEKTLKYINVFPTKTAEVKISAQMHGLITYSFEEESEELIERITKSITGVTRESAEAFVQNLPEVDHVEIHLSPFWQKKMPTIRENIHIEVNVPK